MTMNFLALASSIVAANAVVNKNATLSFPSVDANSQWECEDAHNFQCGAVDGVIVTCSSGRCCSQYGWCDSGNCGGGEQTEFSYDAHGACDHVTAPAPSPQTDVALTEEVVAGKNATLQFPSVDASSQWECEDAHNYQCGAVDGVIVTCDTGRCCSQYGWCDKGNCGGGEQTEFSYDAHGACDHFEVSAVTEEIAKDIPTKEVVAGKNATLSFPPVEANAQWECENTHNNQCGGIDGAMVSCDTGRCCSQYGWCDKGNCDGSEQTEFSYNAHDACHSFAVV